MKALRGILHRLLGFSLKTKLFTSIGILALSIVILIAVQNANKQNGYVLEKAHITSLTEVVSESGTIASDGNVAIYSPTNGTVSELYVQNGQHVSQGQNLFKVVSSASEQEKQTAYATYMAAKASLDASNASLYTLQSSMFAAWKAYTDLSTNSTYENADKSPNTTNRKLPEFTTVQNDWLAAEAHVKNQQGVIAKDQAAVNSAYTAYLATQTSVVSAPLDGIAVNVAYAVGNTIHTPSALLPSVKPVMVLQNSDALEAVVQVGQTNIAKVQLEQKVIIKPDAYKDKIYTGKVVRIDTIGENTQGVVSYNVYVAVEKDALLRPGMTFDCDIVTKTLSNVLTVPNSAVVLNKGVKTVRILKNNTLVYIPVAVGIKGETRTQIVSGIAPGQEVVVSLTNQRAARPGFLGL